MSKIQLVIDENIERKFDLEILKHSIRKYINVKVVKLFQSREQVCKMITNFADFLVCINTAYDFEMNGVQLPCVKSLTLQTRTPSKHFRNGLLSAVKNLTKLHLSGCDILPIYIISCLESNTNLTELVLGSSVSMILFNETLNVEFHLKTLKLDSLNLTNKAENNLKDFMKSQAESIESLKLLNCSFALMVYILNRMKVLRHFTFSHESPLEIIDMRSLLFNKNLRELNFLSNDEQILEMMLGKFPFLKKLYVGSPRIELVERILHLPLLKEFCYAFVSNSNVTIDEIKEIFCNRDIEISQI